MKQTRNFFQRVQSDIKGRKSIELYLVLVATVGLFVADVLGVEAGEALTEIVLAALAVLIYGRITDRHHNDLVEEKLDNFTVAISLLEESTSDFFREEFPNTLKEEFKSATEVWLIGVSLSRTIKDSYTEIEQLIGNGYSVKVLLVHPEGAAVEIASNRDYWEPDVERTKRQIHHSLQLLSTLRQSAPEKLEVRTIDDPLGFGAILINPTSDSGIIYVEHYPFKTVGKTIPRFVLRSKDT